MSDLTQCNYCSLKQIKRNAKEGGKKVEVAPATIEFEASVGKGVHVKVDGKIVAWFMELTNHCVC